MKAILIVVTWLQVGPVVSMTPMHSIVACRAAAELAIHSIQRSAAGNLTIAHQDLVIERHARETAWTATTPRGRHVARVECGAIP
jgi:hypothetical protein